MSDTQVIIDIVKKEDAHAFPPLVLPPPSCKIAVFWSPDCEKHLPQYEDHPENPNRINTIMKHIYSYKQKVDGLNMPEAPAASQAPGGFGGFGGFSTAPPVPSVAPTDSLIDLVISKPAGKEEVLLFHSEQQWHEFNTRCKKSNEEYFAPENLSREVFYNNFDIDTYVMWATYKAVLSSVGAVIDASDAVLTGKYSSAFCAIRPPGHHSSPTTSMGFCFFNNIGVAAKYVLSQPRYAIDRVAILDIDVHHGNGTDDGARLDPRIFYGSTHEKFAFPSQINEEQPPDTLGGRVLNIPILPGVYSRREFRKSWKKILQGMMLFKPQFILVSAGFDAHDEDPLSDIELVDDDFAWVTRKIMIYAKKLGVKIVSALEGGYDLEATATSAVKHLEALHAGYDSITELQMQQEFEQTGPEIEDDLAALGLEEDGAASFQGDEAASLKATLQSLGL